MPDLPTTWRRPLLAVLTVCVLTVGVPAAFAAIDGGGEGAGQGGDTAAPFQTVRDSEV